MLFLLHKRYTSNYCVIDGYGKWTFTWTHKGALKMAYLAIAWHEVDGLEALRLPYCLSILAQAMGYIINIGAKNRQSSVIEHLIPKPDQLGNAIIQ